MQQKQNIELLFFEKKKKLQTCHAFCFFFISSRHNYIENYNNNDIIFLRRKWWNRKITTPVPLVIQSDQFFCYFLYYKFKPFKIKSIYIYIYQFRSSLAKIRCHYHIKILIWGSISSEDLLSKSLLRSLIFSRRFYVKIF